MSVQDVVNALEVRDVSPTARHVLLVLAVNAGGSDDESRASDANVADLTGRRPWVVDDALVELSDAGHVEAAYDHWRLFPALYRERAASRPRGRSPRRVVRSRIRTEVLHRDGFVCQLCGEPVQPEDLTLDHRVPASLGGEDTVENLQVAHAVCNSRKGARQ